ncbi:unnamed protein product [Amaranthus hypochondriacus]
MSTVSTSVNSSFSDLPFNIKTQIFARLPVETLLKCRAVCQSWQACIESPSFISKHRNLYNKEHSKNSHLFIEETSSPRRFCLHRVTNGQKLTTLAFLPSFSADLIVESIHGGCNGLFLLIFQNLYHNLICLWNPFLRKTLLLPSCPIIATPFQSAGYVIGFSTSCDDYKVLAYQLRGHFNGNEYEPAIAVYSLRNNIWTIKINPMNVDAWASLRAPFPCDNYVHCGWVVYWFYEGDSGIIRSFDFNTEEFNNVPVPEPLKECMSLTLFTFGELLAVISSSCIWVMEKPDEKYTWRVWCSESWIQNLSNVIHEPNPFGAKVFFVEQSNTFLVIGFWGSIIFYKVTSQNLEVSRNVDPGFLFVGAYVETLALLTATGTEEMIFLPSI